MKSLNVWAAGTIVRMMRRPRLGCAALPSGWMRIERLEDRASVVAPLAWPKNSVGGRHWAREDVGGARWRAAAYAASAPFLLGNSAPAEGVW